MTHTPSIAIIGTGFGGLGMAIQLKQAGFEDITIFEKADEVGGCWRDNTYPGAACDVPSHLYSFSFEAKSDWSRRFAPQPEILQYLRDTAAKYDLLRHIRFDSEVTAASFDEGAGTWDLVLADGSTHTADVLVAATGQLNRPAYPRIPGIETYEGEIFHSARWNHDYDLAGKKVAVIGTGASAIQFVPQIAPKVAQLELFQRGATYVIPKPDYAYPALVQHAFAKIPGLQRLSRWATYWELEPRALAFTKYPRLMSPFKAKFRKYIDSLVADDELRAKLTPTDPIGCKRILISNDYYHALVRPNVDVVTTGIAEITPTGIVTADGVAHDVDAVILGTGFQATDLLAPMHITGRDGAVLREEWRDGAAAYLGISVTKFPNLFVLYGPNTNLGHSSIVYMLESQIAYVMQAVRRLAKGDVAWLDVRADVQESFNSELQQRISDTVWSQGCTSWYKTAAGVNPISWPGFTFAYRNRTRTFDEADYDLAPASVPALVR